MASATKEDIFQEMKSFIDHMSEKDKKWAVGATNNISDIFDTYNVDKYNAKWMYRKFDSVTDSIWVKQQLSECGLNTLPQATKEPFIVFIYRID